MLAGFAPLDNVGRFRWAVVDGRWGLVDGASRSPDGARGRKFSPQGNRCEIKGAAPGNLEARNPTGGGSSPSVIRAFLGPTAGSGLLPTPPRTYMPPNLIALSAGCMQTGGGELLYDGRAVAPTHWPQSARATTDRGL
jgi:hypothetical protein